MRFSLVPAAFVVLSACQPTVPDSGEGVGFGDYESYQRQQAAREAQLQGQAVPSSQAISGETARGAQATGSVIAADTRAVLDATRSNSGEQPLDASPSNPAPQVVNTPSGISNENDFGAVDARRSIQDDAELRRQQQAQYQVIQPTAVPSRVGSGGPNIVQYALSTSHPVGTSRYRRGGFNAQARYEANCAKYPSPDLAQAEFLGKGGPEKDRLGLDPDGDGYACTWDPAPFRSAKNGG
ncbi:hypothetical protein [Marimonas arenosa]|uniref:Excalibur calcium-binding domain-containing protein n=1 Tax=Marimonas arenosa TaxID=1795305 RepID=A0AAE3WE25_9RHOB|nr:hypothetical protein [Marimonas arenosa]MDQ2090803.1 hypothetical protein [Marimonas arenosa]